MRQVYLGGITENHALEVSTVQSQQELRKEQATAQLGIIALRAKTFENEVEGTIKQIH